MSRKCSGSRCCLLPTPQDRGRPDPSWPLPLGSSPQEGSLQSAPCLKSCVGGGGEQCWEIRKLAPFSSSSVRETESPFYCLLIRDTVS